MNRSSISKWVLSMLLWMWAGGVYFFLEVAWKTSQGRPESISWTMFLLAIILAVPLERFGAELPWEMNVWLNLGVWDYSHLPGNVMGQICPEFAFLWFFLSIVGIVMLDWMRYAVEGGERPHYT